MEKRLIESLKLRGLSNEEAETFMSILNKINPTKEDIEGFDIEMGNGIPFEGGMGFTEALTGLKISLD